MGWMHGDWGMPGRGLLGFGFGGYFMGTILVIVLIVLAIILIVKLSRGQIGGGGNSRGSDSALEIARRRYAQGDISRDEFERIKQDLGS